MGTRGSDKRFLVGVTGKILSQSDIMRKQISEKKKKGGRVSLISVSGTLPFIIV